MMHLHGLRALPALIVVVLAIASSACACGHHQFGCYGSCPGAGSCVDSGGGCQCVGGRPPTPSPPSNSWRCINGQCQKGPGGIDKGSCLSACGPSKDLYKCINNTCVKNGTGVIKSVCGAVCGRTWILGALGESCHTVCGMSGRLCTGGDWGDGDQASLEAAHLFIRLIDRGRYSRDDTMGSGVLSCAGLLHSASGEPVSGGVPFELPLTCCGVKAGTLYGRLHAQRKENSIRDNLRRGHYFKHLFTSSGPLLAARRSARTSRSESDSVSEEDSSSRRSLRAFAARAAATKAPIARSATGLDPPSASGRAGAAKLERRRSSL